MVYYGYYPMVALGYTFAMFSDQVRPGIIATLLLLIVAAQMLATLFLRKDYVLAGETPDISLMARIRYRLYFTGRPAVGTIDMLAALYFIYNLLSGIWCHLYGMPVSVWQGEFCTSILTMVFYIVGRKLMDSERDSFYNSFLIAVCFLGGLGLLLFIWGPQFYLDYLLKIDLISKADVPTMRVRMHSVVGSIQLGYLSVAGMLAAVHIMMRNKGRKGKALLFICMLFAFLSNQRSAMVVAVLVLLFVNYLLFYTYKLLPLKLLAIEVGVLGVGFILMCVIFMRAVMKVYYRLVSLPGAIGQRSDQWIGAINNMSNLWLGNGLGANGHRANGINPHMIADGGLAKLFVEMGIIGTAVFAYMMILCFRYGVKHLKECSAELGIIAVTLLQSIGSNILEFQVVTPIFWFAVGVIAAAAVKYRKPEEDPGPKKKGDGKAS